VARRDDTLYRLVEHGAQLVSNDVVQFDNAYRLCSVRGPVPILIGLAQELSDPELEGVD
jgi:hypothetical protein